MMSDPDNHLKRAFPKFGSQAIERAFAYTACESNNEQSTTPSSINETSTLPVAAEIPQSSSHSQIWTQFTSWGFLQAHFKEYRSQPIPKTVPTFEVLAEEASEATN